MTFQTSPNSFPDLVELDSLRLTVIVDNEVDHMTSVPQELGQTSQALKLYKDQRHLDKEKSSPPTDHAHPGVSTVAFDFNDLCCGAHGLSILVTGVKGLVEHRVLFDTGPQSAIFLDNARRLELEFEKIEVVVLSHWHIDHSGGMLAAVDKIREAKARSEQTNKVVVDLHPDRPDQRGAALKPAGADGSSPAEYVAWGADPSFKALENAGGKVALNGEAHTICEGFFGVSGVIPRLTSYETGIPNHVRWSKAKGEWMSEPEIMDERYLVARVRSKGLVVLTGCSHAGVINVCKDVQNVFAAGSEGEQERSKIFFVVGGFHLAGNSVELRIKETVKDMAAVDPSYMAPGHCSGWRAKAALENGFPGRVVSLGVGSDFFVTSQSAEAK
ncbi:hypothetical protein BG006_003502 [Podila minutissima]|uniref:Metallo-beta-lactamase domain-containing protein n=1 Tax=Podila minutissima TaxID=64525 RepID=A0A9P5S921_9FUNG|nr:hypothetical protein BG006_003502 [Podila minutissima]